MAKNPDEEQDMKRIDDALKTLIEFFDSVQIFATRCEQGSLNGTVHIAKGSGNWFTRIGQVGVWLRREHQYEAERVKKRFGEEGDND